MAVHVCDSCFMLGEWKDYYENYNAHHDTFYGGEYARTCHEHQGEIGERRNFVYGQIRKGEESEGEFVRDIAIIPSLYSRTYYWWTGRHIPKIGLVVDRIRSYAQENNVNEDVVFGFMFIQELMHAYFSAFNGEGYPSILSLENTFAELGMLTFIERTPSIRFMLPDARDYLISRIGKRPNGFGYGAELFHLAGTGAVRMINRYKDISNWTVYSIMRLADIDYWKDYYNYENDPSEQNAMTVFKDITGILDMEWEKPFDSIQPAIGKKGFFNIQKVSGE